MSVQKNKKNSRAKNLDLATVRTLAAQRGIFSIAELARRVPCARVCVYFAIERPSRYPKAINRIKELIHA